MILLNSLQYIHMPFHYWIQYHEFRTLNSHLFSVMNSYYEFIMMKSNSWIQIEYNEFLYLNSYTYKFTYEFNNNNCIYMNSYLNSYKLWIHIIFHIWIHIFHEFIYVFGCTKVPDGHLLSRAAACNTPRIKTGSRARSAFIVYTKTAAAAAAGW